MIILETKELAKSFRVRGRLVEAVKGVTMNVQAGEIFGFLGPNGAGKTTTMRMLTTLLKPSSGQATIAGIDLLQHSRQVREKIGYVSQAGGAEGACSARENLILQARFYGITPHDANVRANELLAALDLEQIADRPSSSYSGGNAAASIWPWVWCINPNCSCLMSRLLRLIRKVGLGCGLRCAA